MQQTAIFWTFILVFRGDQDPCLAALQQLAKGWAAIIFTLVAGAAEPCALRHISATKNAD
jgi:hypothetical protein